MGSMKYVKKDLQKLSKAAFSKDGSMTYAPQVLSSYKEFEIWFAQMRFTIRTANANTFYDIATAGSLHMIRSGEFTVPDALKTLLSPEMMLYLEMPINKVYKDKLLYDLSFMTSYSEACLLYTSDAADE